MYKEKINLVNFFIGKSEYFLSFGAVIAAIFLMSYSVYRINLNYFLFGYFLLLCMLAYFFIKNKNITQNKTEPLSAKMNKIIDIFFILLYILGIISLYFYSIPYERPITFFLIFICMLSSVLIQILLGDTKYFKGLPIPAAASMIALTILLYLRLIETGWVKDIVILVMIYILAFLMVSAIRYFSFKEFGLARRKPFNIFMFVVLMMIMIVMEPVIVLFGFVLIYVFSGPVGMVMAWQKKKALKRLEPLPPDQKAAEVQE